MRKNRYTVWVGGIEVNDLLLSRKDAQAIAEIYSDDGYDDVVIERLSRSDLRLLEVIR